MTTGRGGYEPGRRASENVLLLSEDETQTFMNTISNPNFCKLSSAKSSSGLDGAQWIVEGVRDGEYRIVDRWSPKEGDPVRVIGTVALKLGRLNIPAKDVY